MKRALLFCLPSLFLFNACDATTTPPEGPPSEKGVVNEAALAAGVTVALVADLGTVSVPLSSPVPEVDDSDLQAQLSTAVTLTVTSADSTSVDLASGTLVEDTPDAPGEYTWDVNIDRDAVVFTFYNQTADNLSLEPGQTYDVTFSVSTNDYIQDLSAVSFESTVQ